MKLKLRKARLLASDVQQSCDYHQKVAAEATKQSRQALNDVYVLQLHNIALFLIIFLQIDIIIVYSFPG